MNLNIPSSTAAAMDALYKNGYECYIVGGAVRSALLGLPVHDYDLTTNALPEEMKKVFASFRTVETGIKHGTLTVIIDHHPIEITTYRKDSEYSDHRHPDSITFSSALQEDCARRDFTVNALCYSPASGLLDFFEGTRDLYEKKIRCIGEADKRFNEDALRILRAVRFAAQLGFTIEEKTRQAMDHQKDLLSYVSMERIQSEIYGFLSAPHPEKILYDCRRILAVFMPEIETVMDWDTLKHVIGNSPADPRIRLALILSMMHSETKMNILKRMKLSGDDSSLIRSLLENSELPIESDYDLRRVLHIMPQCSEEYFAFRKALNDSDVTEETFKRMRLIRETDCYQLKDLCIRGDDIVALGARGKQISDILNALLDDVMRDPNANQKDSLMQAASKMLSQ